MLRLLTSGAPIALLMTVAAVPAGAAGWFAHGVKFDMFDRPAIIREATNRATDSCTIQVQAAADRAQEQERARQQAAGADALRIYREALARAQIATTLTMGRVEQEIADYEGKLAAEGRSCPLSADDIEFLYGDRTARE